MKKACVALLCVMTLVATACGQKPNVHVEGQTAVAAAEQEAAEETLDEAGNPVGTDETGLAAGGGTLAAGTTRTTRKGTTTTGPVTGIIPDKNDRAGVSKDTIKIGYHAPLTGAAAVKLDDLTYGNSVYSEWLYKTHGVTIFGRRTLVIFKDDEYKPSTATTVCRELVEKDQVFLLIGAAGTDQIQACARYAFSKKVPYISGGVTEKVVNALPNYFAFSASYPAQGAPLAKLIKTFDASAHGGQGGKVLIDRCSNSQSSGGAACAPDPRAPSAVGGTGPTETPKIAMVYSDTEGFYDARDEFVKAYGDAVLQIKVTKGTISTTQANGVVTQLKDGGIDVVYILTAPTNFANILTPAEGQGYRPRWVGIGLTMGVNLVATTACARQRSSYQHSIFFSPWFSVRHPDSAQWASAWKVYGGPDDQARNDPQGHDLAFGLWGGSIIQHILLKAAGPDLTRSGFIAAVHKLQNAIAPDDTKAGNIVDVFNPLTSRLGSNFGGSTMHILWADCDAAPGNYNYFDKGGRPLTTADL